MSGSTEHRLRAAVRSTAVAAGLLLLGLIRTTAAQGPRLGSLTFPNSGSPAAQKTFLHGVLLLHNFEYDDAVDAFREAERLDPSFALAYWGEALTYEKNLWNQEDTAGARAALRKLGSTDEARAALAPTPRERLYLSSLDALLAPGDAPSRRAAYAEAMRRLHESYPDDDEAAAFYGLSILWTATADAEIARRAGIRAAAVLEDLARRNPSHPGAVHYLVHAYDEPWLASLGLHWARVYAGLAPAAEHAQHMPSHIFIRLGMWDEVAASNEASTAASRAWVAEKGLPPTELDFHSFKWLAYAYLQQGRLQLARQIADSVARMLAGHEVGGMHFDVANGIATQRLFLARETGGWERLDLDPKAESPIAIYALGMAAARLGRASPARDFAGRLRAIKRMPADFREYGALEIDATVAARQGRMAQALELAAKAVGVADRLTDYSPPIFIPAHELFGELLLEAHNPAEAAGQFDLGLAVMPGRSAGLLGRARAAVQSADTAGALTWYRRLLANWHDADPGMPGLDEARGYLASHGTLGEAR